jgi:OFA family oxalate/formate antiporter-like MFS transporter
LGQGRWPRLAHGPRTKVFWFFFSKKNRFLHLKIFIAILENFPQAIQTRAKSPDKKFWGKTVMPAALRSRWGQLVLGIVCMIMIANLQYGWTLFVLPINKAHHWGRPAIQVAFTIFVLCETWLLPVEGYLIDRIGPRLTVAVGGVLIGAAWVFDGQAASLSQLYIGAALGGVGAGCIYGATVGNALKWFPDKRGLAAGLTAAGFGAGSAFTVVPIANMIAAQGYQATFVIFGLIQGVVVLIVAFFLHAPRGQEHVHVDGLSPGGMNAVRPSRLHDITKDYGPGAVALQPVFWLMHLMFVLVAAGGLMATAQLAVIATDFGVAKTPVSLAGITLPALTFALSLDRVLNGVTRPFFGWVSDQIGRETTMFVAFALEGVGILALTTVAGNPLLFVLLTGLVFFAWGEIYSLFPATCGDTFGRKFAATNYGMLYTAKGTAALLVPFGNVIRADTGNWLTVIYLAAAANFVAAALGMFALKPLRRAFIERSMAEKSAERLARAQAMQRTQTVTAR